MKKKLLILVAILIVSISNLWAQEGGVSIGKGREVAHNKAILELVSDTKGLLIPRLTTLSRNAMFKADDQTAVGLLVFDKDINDFFYYTGTEWTRMGEETGTETENLIQIGTVLPDFSNSKKGELYFLSTTNQLAVFDGVIWQMMGNTIVTNLGDVLSNGNSANNYKISDLADPTDAQDAATKSYVDSGLTGVEKTSNKGVADGYVGLGSDGKVSAVYLPGMTLGSTYAVSDEAAQLALTGVVKGDVAIRADESKSYINSTGSNSSMSDWLELLMPAGGVSSINTETGAVVLDLTDILTQGSDADGKTISNLAVPTAAQDAATKKYVDDIALTAGDMKTSVYDADANGKADDADKVNGLTVETAVPVSAVFTDAQTLSDVLTEGTSAGNKTITDLAAPTDAQDAATKSYVDSGLTGVEKTSNKGVADGYVGLGSDGKVSASYLPGMTLGSTYAVSDEAAQLALTGVSKGDVAIRADESKSYINSTGNNSSMSDWLELLMPAGGVSSINTETGAVVLDLTDILTQGSDAGGKTISNLAVPTAGQDAATKKYVDDLASTAGDMKTTVYDADANNKADDADKVNGLTVETAVPVSAVFTDAQTLSDVLTEGADADGKTISNLAVPTADQDAATKKYVDDIALTAGDMKTSVYDADSNGKADNSDNSDKVNGLTVETSVPVNAVFTDAQTLSDVLTEGSDAGGKTISNIGTPVLAADAATKAYVDANAGSPAQNLSDVLTEGSDAGGKTISNIGTPVLAADAATKAYVDANAGSPAQNLSDVLTEGADADGKTISNLAVPTADQDAATKKYVDDIALTAGDMKTSVYDADANGKADNSDNSDKVNGLTVETSVPVNAVFTDAQTLSDVLTEGADADGKTISNLAVPTAGQDAATKKYVDDLASTAGDMKTSVYDADANNKADDADKVNGLTVETAVPVSAVFTDAQTLSDVLTEGTSAGNKTITDLAAPTDAQDAATKSYVDSGLTGVEKTSNKGVADGYVGLGSDGKVSVTYLPGMTMGSTYAVSDEAAQLALTGVSKGDVAIRADESKSYINSTGNNSSMSDWLELLMPAGGVSSINTETGAVVLDLTDILTQGSDAGGKTISNLAVPTAGQDAATKKYVDDLASTAGDMKTSVYDADANNKADDADKVNGLTVETAVPVSAVFTDAQTLSDVLTEGTSAGNKTITDLAAPTDAQDAATKKYVDDQIVAESADNMLKTVYDADSNGKADNSDNSDKVNGLTVETAVPVSAVFTDAQTLSDVLTEGTSAGNKTITDLAAPTDAQDAATKSYVDSGLTGVEKTSNKGVADGYVGLGSDGKVSASYLPGMTLGSTYAVSDEAAQLALTGVSKGDVAIRADESKSYINSTGNNSSMSDWLELLMPAGGVSSINTETGAVVLDLTDILTQGSDAGGKTISNLAVPTAGQDAATKKYVDDLASTAGDMKTTVYDADANNKADDADKVNGLTVETAVPVSAVFTDAQTLSDVLTEGSDAGGKTISNIGTPVLAADAATKAYVDANAGSPAQNLSDVLTEGADADGKTISNLPTADQDAATKKYVDDIALTAGDMKTSVYDADANGKADDADKVNGLTVETAVPVSAVFTDAQTLSDVLTEGADADGKTISNLAVPTADQDAATKKYVDDIALTAGDMKTSVYDADANNKADDADKVNGLTVETAVPVSAVFTDAQTLSDVLTEGTSAGNKAITDLAAPTDAQDAATKSYVDSGLTGVEKTSNKGVADGYVGLGSDGKVSASYLPGMTLGSTYAVSDEAAQLALTGVSKGDVAIRADESKSYINSTGNNSSMSDWLELLMPAGGVSSINTETGAVVLDLTDILTQGSDAGGKTISNLAVPTAGQDAATKKYVDDLASTAGDMKTTVYDADANNKADDADKVNGLTVETAVPVSAVFTDAQTLSDVLTEGTSAGNKTITDLAAPTDAQDAATKKYVDDIALTAGDMKTSVYDADANGKADDADKVNGLTVETAVPVSAVFTDAQTLSDVLTEGSDADGKTISNLAVPTADQDAATKKYVDDIALTAGDMKTSVYDADANGKADDADKVNGLTVETAVPVSAVFTDAQTLSDVLTEGSDADGKTISNLAVPTADQDAATKSYVDSGLTGVEKTSNKGVADGYEKTSNKGVADGYVGLGSDGKVSASYLPGMTLGSTYAVSDEAAQLALTGVSKGDVAIRADESKSYINSTGNNSSMSDWLELLMPAGGVSSINTETGAVVLDLTDILAQGSDAGGKAISNLAVPTADQDAATKKYVDDIALTAGDMKTSVYDADENGKADNSDNSDKVNGLTVETAVPVSAVFTDAQTLSDVLTEGSDAGGKTISNIGTPVLAADAATKAYVDANAGSPAQNLSDVLTEGADADGKTISNLAVPTADQDAATKKYVDDIALTAGDMKTSVYDADANGKADNSDNSDKVNGLTVETAVPVSAVFTDAQTLSDVLTEGSDAGGKTISNIGTPVLAADAATKAYVDANAGSPAQNLSDVLTEGADADGKTISNLAVPTADQDAATKKYVDDIALTAGDMKTSVYDADANGKADDADKVNGLTVETSVPVSAVFTDAQTLSDVLTEGSDAGGKTISNIGTPVLAADAATKAYVDANAGSPAQNLSDVLTEGADADGKTISNLAVPTADQDAATKKYVDDLALTAGDMKTSVYDADANGKADNSDNSDKVNGLTVETAVPVSAVFTDAQTLSDVLTEGADADGKTISNLAVPTADQDAATKKYVDDLALTAGDMKTSVYDADANNKADDADKVNGLTVETAVPVSAVFTDAQTLSDVLTEGTSAGNKTITDLAAPTDAQDAATKSYVDSGLTGVEKTSNKGVADGYVGLGSDGKVSVTYLPGMTMGSTYAVSDEAAQLALTGVSKGDVAIRADESKSYINSTGNNSSMSDWLELLMPAGGVSSINTETGAVVLDLTDILTQGSDAGGKTISNLAVPTAGQDAATKKYVDDLASTAGDMKTSVYDADANNKADDADKVNGLTVETAVPVSAVFTDAQTLSDVLTEGTSAGNKTITDLAAPTDAQDAATKKYVDDIALTAGDMKTSVYDADANGKADDADKVNGLTVETAVPVSAVFTDAQTLSDVLTEGSDADGKTISNLAVPTADQDAATKKYVDDIALTAGDMKTSVYDADANGKADDADKVNGLTVETAVPVSAVFTDAQTLSDVLTEGTSAGNKTITDLAAPTDAQDAATKSYVDSGLTGVEKTSNKGVADGYVGLGSDGKVSASYLPGMTLGSTYAVSDEAAQLALTGVSKGDVAIRADESKSYINSTGNNSSMSDWLELLMPAGGVSSINTETGAVVLDLTDILTQGSDAGGKTISNLAVPTAGQDAATKKYVDDLASTAGDMKTTVYDADANNKADDADKVNGLTVETAVPVSAVFTDAQTLSDVLTEGADADGKTISNLAVPTADQDAATKKYVDDLALTAGDMKTSVYDADANGKADDADKVNGLTVETAVPVSAVFTDAQTLSDVLTEGSDAGGKTISNIGTPVLAADAATKAYVDANAGSPAQNLSDVLTEGSDAGGKAISNLAVPTADQDAATKKYVDDLALTAGDMKTSVYDADANGKADDADKVNGLTVETAVPVSAVFTDAQTLSDVLTEGADADGKTISNLAVPTADQDAATKKYVDDIALTAGDMKTSVYDADANGKADDADKVNGLTVETAVPVSAVFTDAQTLSDVLTEGSDAGGKTISNIGTPVLAADAATKAYVDANAGSPAQNLSDVLTEGADADGKTISNLAVPTADQDAATKKYVDDIALTAGDMKTSVYDADANGKADNSDNSDKVNGLTVETAVPVSAVFTDAQTLSDVLTEGSDAGGKTISNIGTPVLAADAATKAYVDANAGSPAQNLSDVLTEGADADGKTISNLAVPTADQDAATKKYVDDIALTAGDMKTSVYDADANGKADNSDNSDKVNGLTVETAVPVSAVFTDAQTLSDVLTEGADADGKTISNLAVPTADQDAATKKYVDDLALTAGDMKTSVYDADANNKADDADKVNGLTVETAVPVSAVFTDAQTLSDVLTEGSDAGGKTISNIGTPVLAADAATKAYVDANAGSPAQNLSDVLTEGADADGKTISNLAVPTADQDAATKKYVDDIALTAGDMKTSVYDADANGKADNSDNSDKVNGLTVETAVPVSAVFTDAQTLSDVLTEGADADGKTISNLAVPTADQDAATKKYVDDIALTAGDMKTSVYDADANGKADDADKVNGLTVETAVPVSAVFTDAQTLSDVLTEGADADGKTISNLAVPTADQDAATKKYVDDIALTAGDMKTSVYDADANGKADDADKVNGLTVETAVPVSAVFTDAQTLSDVLTEGADADGKTISNLAVPTADQDAATKKYVDDIALTAGDMKTSVYDADANGKADDADKVNGLTVETAVPVSAVFTDAQTLSDVLTEGADADGKTISNLAVPTADQDAATKKYVDDEIVAGSADNMLKTVYDADANGKADDSDKVNGLTVETAVPVSAVFTDAQTLSDVLTEGADADGKTISNLAVPTADQDAATKKYVDDEIVAGSADNMLKTVYDADANGKADDSDLVNGLTVETAVPVDAVFTDEQTLVSILTENTDAGDHKITGLTDPSDAQDAATKAYVDASVVQSDWDQTDSSQPDFIKNKPNTNNAFVYYGTLANYASVSNESEITGLTGVEKANGNLFITASSTVGYFTCALPAGWRVPQFMIDGNDTYQVFKPSQNIEIGGVDYTLWQSDVELPAGLSVDVR
ncbi:beta strand repeat-containing protein [Labilibaculum euxinus]